MLTKRKLTNDVHLVICLKGKSPFLILIEDKIGNSVTGSLHLCVGCPGVSRVSVVRPALALSPCPRLVAVPSCCKSSFND